MIPLVRLGNVAKVLKGRVPAKTIEDDTGARFFGIAEISGHPPRIVEPGIDLSQAIFLRKGDVVVALLGDLGKSAIVNHSGEGAVLGGSTQRCECLTPRVLPTWLMAWTESPNFKAQVAGHALGSVMRSINVRALADFVLPLPPLAYQEELEGEVNRYDAVLTAAREMIRDLEDVRAAAASLAMARTAET